MLESHYILEQKINTMMHELENDPTFNYAIAMNELEQYEKSQQSQHKQKNDPLPVTDGLKNKVDEEDKLPKEETEEVGPATGYIGTALRATARALTYGARTEADRMRKERQEARKKLVRYK